MTWRRLASCLVVAAFISVPRYAIADAADSGFYLGKTITIIAAGSGSYEAFARALASDMPKYITGHPNIIVQVMPGAGGTTAANYLFNVAPRDGTVIGGMYGSVLTASLLTPEAAKFDATRFSWIGNAMRTLFVGFVWNTAPIKSLSDAKVTPVLMGGTGVGGAGIDMAIIARDLFGFKFKVVAGYRMASEVELAMERGEVDGTFAHSWKSLKTEKADWLRDRKVRIIVQHGLTRDRELADVPLMLDFAHTAVQRDVLSLETMRQEIAAPYLAPPEVPKGRLMLLRQAFETTLDDPSFKEKLKRQNMDVDHPIGGKELASLAESVTQTPASSVRVLRELLENFNEGSK